MPRGSNGQEYVEKDGVLRDPKTNIVLARRHPHPYKDVFNAIPTEAGIGFDIPDGIKQLLAIHCFDNLGMSPPQNPRYEYVPPAGTHTVNGQNAVGSWEPPVQGRKTAKEADPERAVVIPDPAGWSQNKLAAMEAAVKREKMRQAAILGADAGVAAELAASEGLDDYQ
ncbi:hypothetical protein GCM10007304_17520 [Rhodococcoides trifolii]|uniref:Uncharacterized protein n=1 Tax=Rhodococcoides trifolii TaxID=908250 RepID=A0A917FV25_9NOCA|nr:hypothetical protein [Rhodococcus trifolii]GGG03875.1 hypothetical protein GCM10007304_17520 [Rhodococcus trifolii]